MPEMKTLNGYEIVDAQARKDIEGLQDALEAIPEVDLTSYATKSELPTKISQLQNDSNFITREEVPKQDLSEYITETELNAKGYLTEHQDLSDYATEQYVDSTKMAVIDLYNCSKVSDTFWQLTDNVKNILQRLFSGERFPIMLATYSHIFHIPSQIYVTSSEIRITLDVSHLHSSSQLTGLSTETYTFSDANGKLKISANMINITDAYEYSKQLEALEARVAALEGGNA